MRELSEVGKMMRGFRYLWRKRGLSIDVKVEIIRNVDIRRVVLKYF